MKFGQELKALQDSAQPPFRGTFLNYSSLKKFLKYRGLQLDAVGKGPSKARAALLRTADQDFLRMLTAQLKEVNRRFEEEAKAIISGYDTRKKKNLLSRFLHADQLTPKAAEQLAARAQNCQKYVRVNALALRKICKKHDRTWGVRTGQQFLQACWRGEVSGSGFLSGTMVQELGAVEALLRQEAPGERISPNAATRATLERRLSDASKSDMPMGEAEEIGDDFKCAICLDLLYLPVALACGHVFCARCAVSVAYGHDHSVGSAEGLLEAAFASPAPCPSCRATAHGKGGEGVFAGAQRLRHLDRLLQSRYRQDWERRRAEDEEEQAAQRAELQKHSRWHFFRTASPTSSGAAAAGT